MRRATIATLIVSLGVATAYAIPPIVALPGSTPMPRYSRTGDVMYPVPIDRTFDVARALDATEINPGVYSVASIYLENANEAPVYPWALYVETRTRHTTGGATVVNARLRNEGTGWGAAAHSEVIATGGGTSIGSNVEVSPMGTGRVVGVVVQAKNGYTGVHPGTWTNEGVLLQSDANVGFIDGMRCEARTLTGLHFASTSSSQRAIWIEGAHAVGIDVGSSPIRMNAGTPIALEATGMVTVRYLAGRIEFRYGTRVLGWLATDMTASGGRMN